MSGDGSGFPEDELSGGASGCLDGGVDAPLRGTSLDLATGSRGVLRDWTEDLFISALCFTGSEDESREMEARRKQEMAEREFSRLQLASVIRQSPPCDSKVSGVRSHAAMVRARWARPLCP